MWQGFREDLPCGCTVSCSCKSTTDQPCQQQLTDKQKFFLTPEATEALENSYQAGGELAFPITCLSLYWSAAFLSSKYISLAVLIFLPPIFTAHGEAAPSLPACSHSPDPFCFSSLWLSAWEGELSKWAPSVLFSYFIFIFRSKVAHVYQHVFTFLPEQFGQSLRALWDGNLVAKLCFSLCCSQSIKLNFLPFKYCTQK